MMLPVAPDRAFVARETAKMFLEVKAVNFYDGKPFIFTSGTASPVYIDCRKLISFPRLRSALMDFAVGTIVRDIGYESIDAIAGGETAGIPFAAWISDRLGLPMQYIRKKPKGLAATRRSKAVLDGRAHAAGRGSRERGYRARSTSCRRCATPARRSTIASCCSSTTSFPARARRWRDMNVALHYLTTWWDVLAVAKESGHFAPKVLDEVERFLHAPVEWSAAHGGETKSRE